MSVVEVRILFNIIIIALLNAVPNHVSRWLAIGRKTIKADMVGTRYQSSIFNKIHTM